MAAGFDFIPSPYLMAGCELTQDYALDCRDSIGGVKEINFIELPNLSSITETSGVVTALTKKTGKRFYKYNLIKSTANAEDTLMVSEENGTTYSEQKIKIVLNKMQANTRNEIKLLGKNLLVAVVVDRNKKYWLYGATNGLVMKTAKGTTGTKPGDRNGYDLEFEGQEDEQAFEVSQGVYDALTTPA